MHEINKTRVWINCFATMCPAGLQGAKSTS